MTFVDFLGRSHKNSTNLQNLKSLDDTQKGDVVLPEVEKPDFKEVYAYAEKQVTHAIRKKARHLPKDQQEEIFQDAMMRTWQAYQNLDAQRGWKSFIQTHCNGACLDYLKGGNGNIEDGHVSEGSFDGLKTRVEVHSEKEDGAVLSVEDTAAFFGVFHGHDAEPDRFSPDWDLLSRMAGKDEDLHIVAKVLLGRTQEEIADEYSTSFGATISRERISQRIYELFRRFDAIENLNDRWIRQSIFALGLSEYYHEPAIDLGIGHDLHHFDLHDPESFRKVRSFYSPSLFDFAKMDLESTTANEVAI